MPDSSHLQRSHKLHSVKSIDANAARGGLETPMLRRCAA